MDYDGIDSDGMVYNKDDMWPKRIMIIDVQVNIQKLFPVHGWLKFFIPEQPENFFYRIWTVPLVSINC